jgi:hypothetical protein
MPPKSKKMPIKRVRTLAELGMRVGDKRNRDPGEENRFCNIPEHQILDTEMANLRVELGRRTREVARLTVRVAQLDTEVRDTVQAVRDVRRVLRDTERERDEAEADHDDMALEIADLHSDLHRAETEVTRLGMVNQELQTTVAQLQGRAPVGAARPLSIPFHWHEWNPPTRDPSMSPLPTRAPSMSSVEEIDD